MFMFYFVVIFFFELFMLQGKGNQI